VDEPVGGHGDDRFVVRAGGGQCVLEGVGERLRAQPLVQVPGVLTGRSE
jgi:hypothetical protein